MVSFLLPKGAVKRINLEILSISTGVRFEKPQIRLLTGLYKGFLIERNQIVTMDKPLSELEIQEELQRLNGWEYTENRIVKTFQFKHFAEAMSFIVRLSYECEKRNHHPEIYNLYNEVTIGLNTHIAGDKVTAKDVVLAKDIDHFAWRD